MMFTRPSTTKKISLLGLPTSTMRWPGLHQRHLQRASTLARSASSSPDRITTWRKDFSVVVCALWALMIIASRSERPRP